MRRAPHGDDRAGSRVVNMGSAAGFFAPTLMGAYAASKHAVEALTDCLRREIAPDGLHASVIEPGSIDTDIEKKMATQLVDYALDKEGLRSPYAPRMAAMAAKMKDVERHQRSAPRWARLMNEPAVVSDAVVDALTSARPRARYVVGYDARSVYMLQHFAPTAVVDRLLDLFV